MYIIPFLLFHSYVTFYPEGIYTPWRLGCSIDSCNMNCHLRKLVVMSGTGSTDCNRMTFNGVLNLLTPRWVPTLVELSLLFTWETNFFPAVTHHNNPDSILCGWWKSFPLWQLGCIGVKAMYGEIKGNLYTLISHWFIILFVNVRDLQVFLIIMGLVVVPTVSWWKRNGSLFGYNDNII